MPDMVSCRHGLVCQVQLHSNHLSPFRSNTPNFLPCVGLSSDHLLCPRTSPPGQQPANCYIESLDRKTALAVLLITLCVSKRHLSPWPVLLTSSFINPFDPSRPVCIRVFTISLSASWCMSLGLMRCRPGECTRGKLQFAMTE